MRSCSARALSFGKSYSPDTEPQDVEGGALCLLLRKEHCLRFGRPNLAALT
jgi:hypothetical protein